MDGAGVEDVLGAAVGVLLVDGVPVAVRELRLGLCATTEREAEADASAPRAPLDPADPLDPVVSATSGVPALADDGTRPPMLDDDAAAEAASDPVSGRLAR